MVMIASLASMAASAAGAAVSAIGSAKQGAAEANMSNYNAQVQAQDAKAAQQNAQWAGAAGEQQTEQKQLQTRATVGALKANEAAGNIDVNSGSAVDVRSSAAQLGQLDAINIRANAARQAYGYQTQATSYEAESNLDRYAANNDVTAGDIGAAGTFLGGAGNAGSNWANFMKSGMAAGGTHPLIASQNPEYGGAQG